jgi:hypothetical protein
MDPERPEPRGLLFQDAAFVVDELDGARIERNREADDVRAAAT